MARIYFSPLQVDLLVERLDEPADVTVAITPGYDVAPDADKMAAYDAVVCYCDSMNGDLKAAKFITTPLSDLEKTILAHCITFARAAKKITPAQSRIIVNTAAKLRAAGVEIAA